MKTVKLVNKMKYLSYSFLLWLCLITISQAQSIYSPQTLSPQQLREDLQVLRINLAQIHPGLYTYTSKPKLDALFDHIQGQLDTPMTALAFFQKLMPLHRVIGNNHTAILPPADYVEALKTDLPRLPLRLYWYRDTLFVQEDLSRETQIGVGSKIKSINGEAVLGVFQHLAQQLTTDGFNISYPYTAAGQAFSRYYAYFFGTPTSFVIEYITSEGFCRTTEIQAIPFEEIMARRKEQVKSTIGKDVFSFSTINGLGILRIGSFHIDRKRNISIRAYNQLLAESFAQIKSEKMETLILDLRDNGGGFPEAAHRLLRYLITETVHPVKEEYALVKSISVPHHFQEDLFFKHFNRQPLKWDGQHFIVKGAKRIKVKPRSHSFTGKLIVLMNAKCTSATAELLGQIATHCNATFIGEETGGNPVTQVASDLLSLILPNSQLKVQLPAIRSVMNVNFENTGHGLQPDIPFRPRVEDVVAGKDTLLEFAITQAVSNSGGE